MTTSLPVAGPVPVQPQPTPLVSTSNAASSSGGSGLSFGDILDTINPLQHIPVLSSAYRAMTGSQISSGAQVAGDTLYGALLPGGALMGFAASAADVAVKEVTGKNIAQNVLSAVTPSSSAPAATPLVPDNQANTAATTTAKQTPISPVPLSSNGGHSQNSQYQRAAMLDFINSGLIKMTA